MMYFLSDTLRRANSHFFPVGNPPPPRPRRPESVIAWQMSSGDISSTAFAAAS